MKTKEQVRSRLVFLVGSEMFLGIAGSLVAGKLFFEITDHVIDQNTIFFDNLINTIVYGFRTPGLTLFMKAVSFLGMDLILAFSLLIPLIFVLKKRKNEAWLFFMITSMGAIINLLLKTLIQRNRPIGNSLAFESTFSFPSGHSMNSFIFFMTAAYFCYKLTKSKKVGVFAFTIGSIIIFLVGLSRVYLGVHYPSDILGGYVAGAFWMIAFYAIEKSWTWIRLIKST